MAQDTPQTFYPGVGADAEIEKLERLVGKIMGFWAQVEDGLFNVFVVAITGTLVAGDIRPYRAVFFTFSAYEGKMRMVDNAMKARFRENNQIIDEWGALKKSLDSASALRNTIAHLTAMAKATPDKDLKANVRLVPPFWKGTSQERDFDTLGYSWNELTQALAPFWGFDPSLNIWDTSHHTLGYRLDEFARKLGLPRPLQPDPSSNS